MTNYSTVPKSIRRVQEEWNGLPLRYMFVLLIMASLTVVFVILIAASKIKIIPALLLLSVWIIFFKYLRTPVFLERSWLAYQYFLRSYRGQTLTAKYAMPEGFLKDIVPIEKFHEKGVIEFKDKRYGMIYRVDPSRISDDDLDSHIGKVKYLIDSLHGQLIMKTFVCSIPSTSYRPLENNLIKTINEKGKTKEQKEHLYSIYHEANNNSKPIIHWQFYVFIGFGVYPSPKDAEIGRQQYCVGFENRLQKAGMRIVPIMNKDDLALTFRQCIMQQVIT